MALLSSFLQFYKRHRALWHLKKGCAPRNRGVHRIILHGNRKEEVVWEHQGRTCSSLLHARNTTLCVFFSIERREISTAYLTRGDGEKERVYFVIQNGACLFGYVHHPVAYPEMLVATRSGRFSLIALFSHEWSCHHCFCKRFVPYEISGL